LARPKLGKKAPRRVNNNQNGSKLRLIIETNIILSMEIKNLIVNKIVVVIMLPSKSFLSILTTVSASTMLEYLVKPVISAKSSVHS
jgi:hypothetical protein